MLQVIVKLFSAQNFDGGVLKFFVLKVLQGRIQDFFEEGMRTSLALLQHQYQLY